MHNNQQKSYPEDLGVLYYNVSAKGEPFLRGYVKRKDGTKVELFGKYFEKPSTNSITGQPEVKKIFSLRPYVPKNSTGVQQNVQAPQTPVAQVAAPVKIDDDIPF